MPTGPCEDQSEGKLRSQRETAKRFIAELSWRAVDSAWDECGVQKPGPLGCGSHLPTVVFPMMRGAWGNSALSSRRSGKVAGASQVVLSPWNVSRLLLGSSAILWGEADH